MVTRMTTTTKQKIQKMQDARTHYIGLRDYCKDKNEIITTTFYNGKIEAIEFALDVMGVRY